VRAPSMTPAADRGHVGFERQRHTPRSVRDSTACFSRCQQLTRSVGGPIPLRLASAVAGKDLGLLDRPLPVTRVSGGVFVRLFNFGNRWLAFEVGASERRGSNVLWIDTVPFLAPQSLAMQAARWVRPCTQQVADSADHRRPPPGRPA